MKRRRRNLLRAFEQRLDESAARLLIQLTAGTAGDQPDPEYVTFSVPSEVQAGIQAIRCVPVSAMHQRPGNTSVECAGCGERVWLWPRARLAHMAGIKAMCPACEVDLVALLSGEPIPAAKRRELIAWSIQESVKWRMRS